jgi:hypothetical protein
MGDNIKLYFHGTKEEVAARQQRLRDLAKGLGYTAIASTAATQGEGNIPTLLEAIDAGEVVVVKLRTEHYGWLVGWLDEVLRALHQQNDMRNQSLAVGVAAIIHAIEAAWARRRA